MAAPNLIIALRALSLSKLFSSQAPAAAEEGTNDYHPSRQLQSTPEPNVDPLCQQQQQNIIFSILQTAAKTKCLLRQNIMKYYYDGGDNEPGPVAYISDLK